MIIREIPHGGNKAGLVTRIAELVNDRIIEGVSDIRDESDRDGMRVVIELRKGADAAAVQAALFKHTKLSVKVSMNMIALVDGAPRSLGLLDMLRHFVEFRRDVIRKRTTAALAAALERVHVVQGLRAALSQMDATVAAIRGAADSAAAAKALHKDVGLTDVQAAAVLAMPLRRLTGLETAKLAEEDATLQATIADLEDLLSKDKRVVAVLVDEAQDLKARFGRSRRTKLGGDAAAVAAAAAATGEAAEVADVECLITLSERGYIKRMRPAEFSGRSGGAQRRGTRGKAGGRLRADDSMMRVLSCRDKDTVLLFTERGRAFALPAHAVPESTRAGGGTPLPQLMGLAPGETATAVLAVSEFTKESTDTLIMLTERGWLKRMQLAELASIRNRTSGIIALKIEPGDALRFVRQSKQGDILLIGSSDGNIVRFPIDDEQLRVTGRGARGVTAMDLRDGATCVGMDVLPAGSLPAAVLPGFESGLESGLESGADSDGEGAPTGIANAPPPWALIVTQRGFAKRVPVAAFRQVTRGCKGVRALKLSKDGGDSLASVRVVGLPPPAKRANTRAARRKPRASGGGDASESDVSDGEEEEGEEGEEALEEEVVVATENGIINRCAVSAVTLMTRASRGWPLLRLDEGDKVRATAILPGSAAPGAE